MCESRRRHRGAGRIGTRRADRVDLIWEIKGAIRPALVSWAARINNLTDEVLRGEIIRAARRCGRKLVPEE